MAESKKKHKYIARVKVKRITGKTKWRYFYDMDEYKAYLEGLKDKSGDALKDLYDGSFVKKLFSKSKMSLESMKKSMETGKEWVSNLFAKSKKKKFSMDDYYKQKADKDKKKREAAEAKRKAKEARRKEAEAEAKKDSAKTRNDKAKKKKSLADKIKDLVNPKSEEELCKDLKKKTKKQTASEDQAAVNPYYDTGVLAYGRNCIHCSATYELRRRGYDVEAMGDNDGETLETVTTWYKDEQIKSKTDYASDKKKAAKEIEKEIKKNGNGSRGQYIVYWSLGSAHSMVWEVENDEVVIRDCQTNKIHTVEEITALTKKTVYFRTDNLDLEEEILNSVKNKKK